MTDVPPPLMGMYIVVSIPAEETEEHMIVSQYGNGWASERVDALLRSARYMMYPWGVEIDIHEARVIRDAATHLSTVSARWTVRHGFIYKNVVNSLKEQALTGRTTPQRNEPYRPERVVIKINL